MYVTLKGRSVKYTNLKFYGKQQRGTEKDWTAKFWTRESRPEPKRAVFLHSHIT